MNGIGALIHHVAERLSSLELQRSRLLIREPVRRLHVWYSSGSETGLVGFRWLGQSVVNRKIGGSP